MPEPRGERDPGEVRREIRQTRAAVLLVLGLHDRDEAMIRAACDTLGGASWPDITPTIRWVVHALRADNRDAVQDWLAAHSGVE